MNDKYIIKNEEKLTDVEEFFDRVADGEMKLGDIPILALFILCALAVVIGEIGCIVWFFAILIFALCNGAAELLMLIPCLILFSILSAIISFVSAKYDLV